MSMLEYLICPGHCYGDCWAESEAYDEETAVARPGVCDAAGVGGEEEPEYLEAHWDAEEYGAVVVEAVG